MIVGNIKKNNNYFLGIKKKQWMYRTKYYTTSTAEDLFYLGDCFFVSNENYELKDTIKFIRYASNER